MPEDLDGPLVIGLDAHLWGCTRCGNVEWTDLNAAKAECTRCCHDKMVALTQQSGVGPDV